MYIPDAHPSVIAYARSFTMRKIGSRCTRRRSCKVFYFLLILKVDEGIPVRLLGYLCNDRIMLYYPQPQVVLIWGIRTDDLPRLGNLVLCFVRGLRLQPNYA